MSISSKPVRSRPLHSSLARLSRISQNPAENIFLGILDDLVARGSSHNVTKKRGIYLIHGHELADRDLDDSFARALVDPARPMRPDCALAITVSSVVAFYRIRLTEAGMKGVPVDQNAIEARLRATPSIKLVSDREYFLRRDQFIRRRIAAYGRAEKIAAAGLNAKIERPRVLARINKIIDVFAQNNALPYRRGKGIVVVHHIRGDGTAIPKQCTSASHLLPALSAELGEQDSLFLPGENGLKEILSARGIEPVSEQRYVYFVKTLGLDRPSKTAAHHRNAAP
jgi:hypothetical protein